MQVYSQAVTADIYETDRQRLMVCEQNFTSYQLPSSSLRQQQRTINTETSGAVYPATQHHIPEDRNSLLHRCEKLIILQEVYTYRSVA
jgi:hypothetical protein